LWIPGATTALASGQQNANWLSLAGTATDFGVVAQQVTDGLAPSDLAACGGSLALAGSGNLSVFAAPAPTGDQAAALQAALFGIRGQKRVWPIGTCLSSGGQPTAQIQGFVAGCVVDCEQDGDSMKIVVQACTVETATAMTGSPAPANPWIGKLILNEGY
jgi:hypothetical protein